MMQGFLLGLANGTTCLAYCIPVLVPFLLQEGRNVRQNLAMLFKFLGGRLGGYVIFGLVAWATGNMLVAAAKHQGLVVGTAYVGLSVLLLVTVLRRQAPAPGACAFKGAQVTFSRWPALLPVGMGFLAGLRICPPLLLAFADAANTGTCAGSLTLFLMFFLGTSIYFIPLSFLGAWAHVPDLRIVGRFAAVIVAVYYMFSGILLFAGGVS
jgi:sulfite exporter TauE/SafE